MNIYLAKTLYSLGFTYHHYQQNIYKGMIFQIGDEEYVVGGNTEDDISDAEKDKIKDGVWIPSAQHLIEWLGDNDFAFAIVYETNLYKIVCKDTLTSTEFHAESPDFDTAIFSIVRKILKKKERAFDYKEKIYGEIIKDTEQ